MKTQLMLAALILSVLPADGDVLSFALTPTDLSAPAGDATTLEFSGTLSNLTQSDVFLNGTLSALDQSMTLDDSPFFTFSPLFLPSGGTYNGRFFDVVVESTILPGSYIGSFTIQGGSDANQFNDLATQAFTVNVVATTAVPEPAFPEISLVVSTILYVRWRGSRRGLRYKARAVSFVRGD